mmetsp:Transcript_19972/g.24219  ORF Transcript_19972/g.24219 Transcript_19972/m.24219 type:complete len:438 (+) Transcript_19972:207-1520(+)|eukprot:CAMPEP_0204832926 /NCGR_PEP_ID=MMETSP1346-20131115/15154_1 /ASSEMBLY_ACC=CAM_ASM_000771 /TAXON_ID=215587 /ORGANISM="Aplanochytrium stocchinoi, Strain GSBS06" /LENGTH=437 /DNA_ID=CAMNT_0051965051 /DNA_START=366 /DNA_END=1679 /DNA_ORIENTATION=+
MSNGTVDCDLYGELDDGAFASDDLALTFCGNVSIVESCLTACQKLRCDELDSSASATDKALEYVAKVLTFLLVAGFAATVDHRYFYNNFKSRSVYVGICCQFLVMPALGFLSVAIFNNSLPPLYAVILITVTACPGGAYSNWFCSVFNGDLALSVAMTSASSILASIMLPLNIFLYVTFAYASISDSDAGDIVRILPYDTLLITLAVVVVAVVSGLYFGYKFHNRRHQANFVGNVAGILIQALGLFASSTSCSPPWEQDWQIFLAVLLPLSAGVTIAILVSRCVGLPKPQQFAISIETAYQNVGIALAIALSLGSAGREAAVIPVLYGVFEAVIYFPYCFIAVFSGMTLSPRGERLYKVLLNDYQDLIETSPLYRAYNKEMHLSVRIEKDVEVNGTDDSDTDTSETAVPNPMYDENPADSKNDEPKGYCMVFGFYLI